jgi:hypothetical protein
MTDAVRIHQPQVGLLPLRGREDELAHVDDRLGALAHGQGSVGERLLEAAAGEPLVIALDGVHWADPVTLMALRALPPRCAAQPICWLLARLPGAGDADLRRTIDRLRDAGASTIRLEPIRDPRRAPRSGGAPARAAVAP